MYSMWFLLYEWGSPSKLKQGNVQRKKLVLNLFRLDPEVDPVKMNKVQMQKLPNGPKWIIRDDLLEVCMLTELFITKIIANQDKVVSYLFNFLFELFPRFLSWVLHYRGWYLQSQEQTLLTLVV
jgi:hypothetical protein